MNSDQKKAYEWAKNQNYSSVAAQYAKELANYIDEIKPYMELAEKNNVCDLVRENRLLPNAINEDTGLTPEEIMDGRMLTGWIPVEDQLPQGKADVLICTRNAWILVGWYGPISECWHRTPDGTGYLPPDVVAWMPLPEPYKPFEKI